MQNYNSIQKFLHQILLGYDFSKKSLYELEKILYLNKTKNINKMKHVFITGLPRSGTTALLNFIYNSKNFISITYNNMPFVMAPNLSTFFFQKNKIQSKERLHQDGIYFSLDSPEAFDEIFFSSFQKEELEEELQKFISLVLLKNEGLRYLSKNNLNYKRIKLISKIFPNSIFLIPFRDPLQQSFSLLRTHLLFSKIQSENPFVRKYMKYLYHREFGIDHVPWFVSDQFTNYNDVNYWLEQWIKFYSDIHFKFNSHKNCFFLRYENLSKRETIEKISHDLEILPDKRADFKISKKSISEKFDKNLYIEAMKIYENIVSY